MSKLLRCELTDVVNRLIGTPWSPPTFTCWDFVVQVYREAFAIELPPLVMDATDPRSTVPVTAAEICSGRWRGVTQPSHGDVVAMGRRGRPHHCGVWVDYAGGLVGHCDAPYGVTAAPLQRMQLNGWGSFRYYRHVDLI